MRGLLVLLVACGSTEPVPREPVAAPPPPPPTISILDAAPAVDAPSTGEGIVLRGDPGAELQLARFARPAISPDGTRVVTTSDKEVVLWDADHGRVLQRWPVVAESVQFLPDGRVLVTLKTTIELFAADGARTVIGEGTGGALASPDGAWIACESRQELVMFSLRGERTVLVKRPRQFGLPAFSPDSSRFFVVVEDRDHVIPEDTVGAQIFDRGKTGWKLATKRTLATVAGVGHAAMRTREMILLNDRIINLTTGVEASRAGRSVDAVSSDGRAVLLSDHTGMSYWFELVVGNNLGEPIAVARPPAANRGHAIAVSARGHVVWCTRADCVVGPPLPGL
jgi:hypothetical protein